MTTTGIIVSFLALIVGALVGALIGYRTARQQATAQASAEHEKQLSEARLDASTARAEAARAREDAAGIRAELAGQLAEKAELRTAASDADRRVAEVRAELSEAGAARATAEAQRDAALARVETLVADQESMAIRFKALSEESLERQGAKADKTNAERMAATQQLVAPLAESLKALTERLGEVEKERSRLSAELGQQVKAVAESGESIRKETLTLANALRTPQVRGAWGEASLRRMAEISGMVARCDFDDQTTYTSSDGERFRPDMRVSLPDERVVFVDSKVPLSAILDAYNTEDQDAQKQHIARFAKHVRTHIEQLGNKGYWQLDLRSPDFVVLFLGSDEFLRLALEEIPDLHDFAARHDVVLSSPGLLIPLLRTISHGWKQSELAESAAEVIKLGRDLFDRLITMGSHVDKLGRAITTSVRAYNSAVSSLESRVMVSARRFNDLNVSESELTKLTTIDDPVREAAVPEMLAYEEQRQALTELFEDRSELELGSVAEFKKRTGTDE